MVEMEKLVVLLVVLAVVTGVLVLKLFSMVKLRECRHVFRERHWWEGIAKVRTVAGHDVLAQVVCSGKHCEECCSFAERQFSAMSSMDVVVDAYGEWEFPRRGECFELWLLRMSVGEWWSKKKNRGGLTGFYTESGGTQFASSSVRCSRPAR